MKYNIDGQTYDVQIVKKNNKNTYLRVKDDLTILVTTNYFTSQKVIEKMLLKNYDQLKKMLNRQKQKQEKMKSFFYLGKPYDIIELSTIGEVEVSDSYIYIPNQETFNIWYKKQLLNVFSDRLDYNYHLFKEATKCPVLKIRTMKTRWGVYNRLKHSITLNSHLLEYDYDKIDYVIIHELCHIVHFDHSHEFWTLVSKYCPNYKQIRKELKE